MTRSGPPPLRPTDTNPSPAHRPEATPLADPSRPPRVLLVGDNASLRMGGEPSVGLLYFKRLRAHGVEAWLLCHGRCRDELRDQLGGDFDRAFFVDDDRYDRWIWSLGQRLPTKVYEQTLGVLLHVHLHRRMRKVASGLIGRAGVEVVHEVTPVSPRLPSLLHGLGVPLVIGPMSGAMDYPPAFQDMQSRTARWVERFGRMTSGAFNRLLPGKARAEALVVANAQTRAALPRNVRGTVHEGVSEIAVDLDVWGHGPPDRGARDPAAPVRFIYLGRLVDWKAVDLLIGAFRRVADVTGNVRLELAGDGPMRPELEALTDRLGLRGQVTFSGWAGPAEAVDRLRRADVFVLPSLRECGGIVLLEAMAVALPVIATDWGGPATHVDDSCGVRVPPDTRESFVAGLADAMLRLARDPALRESMGRAGARKVHTGNYNWDLWVKVFLGIYGQTLAAADAARARIRVR